MLVLTRKAQESILIGDDIRVVILRTGSRVWVGIEAPKEVTVLRSELLETKENAA